MSMREGKPVRDGNYLEAVFSATSIGPSDVGCGGLGGTIAYDSYPRTLQATVTGGYRIKYNRIWAKDQNNWCPGPHRVVEVNAILDHLPVILFNGGTTQSWRVCTCGYTANTILKSSGGSIQDAIWDGPGPPPDACAASRFCKSANIQVWLNGNFTLGGNMTPNGGHASAHFELRSSLIGGITYTLDVADYPFNNFVQLEIPAANGTESLIPLPSTDEKVEVLDSEVRSLTFNFDLNQP